MNLRVTAPLFLGLATLLSSGCAPAPLRVDLRRDARPWTPPRTTPACPAETVVPYLWIEPPPAHASWVFQLVMGPKDSINRPIDGIPGPEGDPLLPPGIALDAVVHHDPCLGIPSHAPRMTLRLRDANGILDTLSVPLAAGSIASVLDEAPRHATPPRSWESDHKLWLELDSVGSTPALDWLGRIWCDAGCRGGWRDEPCREGPYDGSSACENLVYRHPEAIWIPGEEHVLRLRLHLPPEQDRGNSAPHQTFSTGISLDLDARTLRRTSP